ncbi:hypothetical protein QJQ45_024285, partial [Haematococcus lacustris]
VGKKASREAHCIRPRYCAHMTALGLLSAEVEHGENVQPELSRPAPAPASEGQGGRPSLPPFHLAIPVRDVAEARHFYTQVLGCGEGRSAKTWVDFNFWGHQVVAHLVPGYNAACTANAVDGDAVPVPHFGAALSCAEFHALAARLQALEGFQFVIHPHLRFKGAPGEQWTMFFHDPSNNALEFKAMTNPDNLFAQYRVD